MIALRLLILSTTLALAACRSRPPPPERGSPDPGVVLVVVKNTEGDEGLCTGVVISPHLVLTAAHCLSLQTVGPHPHFTIFLGGDYHDSVRARLASHRVAVAAMTYDPAFDANVLPAGHDIGLLMTRAPLGVPLIGVSTTPLPAHIHAGRLVGYGIANSGGGKPEADSGGVRRDLQVHLRGASTRFLALGDGRTQPCAGDSGGPVLARLFAGGPELVVGIVSYGDVRCRRAPLVTDIARYADYLRDFLARDAIPAAGPQQHKTVVRYQDAAGVSSFDAGGFVGLPSGL